jgi:rod shape-determining protein MreC
MLLDHRVAHLERVRQALNVVVYPVRMLVDLPFSVWSSASATFTSRDELLVENERLARELLTAEFKLQRLAALEVENTRLRELVDSSARIGSRALIAEILAIDLDPYRQRFNLNRGSRDGVFVGQALLDAQGVVGQVVRVDPLTSEAMLITDADHALPVKFMSGLRTIAVGTGDYGRLRLRNLTNNVVDEIVVGDLLVSSGLGGLFPEGHPVARVTEIKRTNQAFAEVIAAPVSALDRDREVLLVWDSVAEERTPHVAEEDHAEASAATAVALAAPLSDATAAPGADPASPPAETAAATGASAEPAATTNVADARED